MSKRMRWSVLLLALILPLAAIKPAAAICIDNPNSSLTYIDGEAVCAYTGGGCSSCYTGGPRGGGSWDLCYIDWGTGDLVCTYYM